MCCVGNDGPSAKNPKTKRQATSATTTPKLTANHFHQTSFLKIVQASPGNLPVLVEERSDLAHSQHPVFYKALDDLTVRCFQPE
jgi:hypothetical protein